MRFDDNIKECIQEDLSECKKCVSNMNGKYNKNIPKIGRKGIDSLLGKLESCSQNVNTCINQELVETNLQMAKRVSNRVKSMSPDCKKSRSLSSREDDVISPRVDDDSIDMKQSRKRKLGKPVRLSKESKLAKANLLIENSKSEITLKSESNEYFPNLLPTFKRDTKERVTGKFENSHKEMQLSICQDKEFDSKENQESKMNISAAEKKYNKQFNECNQHKQTSVLDMSKYLLDALKSTKPIKPRRSSESVFYESRKKSKTRRKSCDNIKDLLNQSILHTSVPHYTTAFHEVESQLEKMFAGIIEVDKKVSKTSKLVSHKSVGSFCEDKTAFFVHENLTKGAISRHKFNKTKAEKKNRRKKLLKMHSEKKLRSIVNKISNNKCTNKKKLDSHSSTTKKKVLKKGKDNICLNELGVETSLNTGIMKCKGPIIQIKGFQKMLSNIQIVNTPKEDDEEKNKEKRRISSNGIVGRTVKSNFSANLDYRGKSSNAGLFNSTLSTRYDADTTDITWICVFCKRGPHCIVSECPSNISTALCDVQTVSHAYAGSTTILSDLFGPYLIDSNWIENTSIDAAREIPLKMDNKTISKLDPSIFKDQMLLKDKRKKSQLINNSDNLYMGMNKLNDDDLRWEIWIHEQCIIWTAGVFITAGRICGLQDAVWDAAKSICDICSISGANIGCIKRGCKSVAHYCCALASGWHLDISHFLPTCNGHTDI